MDPNKSCSSSRSELGTLTGNKQKYLRVAFFTSHPVTAGSGSERLMYDTSRSLLARGHDARVYVMNSHLSVDPPFFEEQLPTLPIERKVEYVFRRGTGWNDILFPSTSLLRFYPWIGNADIWHLHNLHGHYMSIPVLGLWSWTKRIVISPVDQYLSTGHCPYPIDCEHYLAGCGSCPRLNEPWPGIARDSTRTLWRMKRLFLRLGRVNTFFHTEALAKLYKNTNSHLVGPIIRYGVDINCFRPLPRSECASALRLKESSRFVIGLLHSHVTEARKGILALLEHLGELSKRFSGKLELLVVGQGSEKVREIDFPDLTVKTLPFLKELYRLAQAINLCDVILYPTQAENLSLTCLYSLACGVPVISFDVGGQKEAITNGVNGYLVEVNDYQGMTDALVRLLETPTLYRKLAEGARFTAEEYFDFDQYIDRLLEYYYGLN